MAMALLRQRLSQNGLEERVSVSSAGVYALEDYPASRPGVEVMAERGIDVSDHRGHTVTEQDMMDADLVLVMEEEHRRSLFYRYPQLLGKVFLLSEMAGQHHDIADPYRRPKVEYERCADELDGLLDLGWENILARLGIVVQG
jgi:protein-tyrosine-phosphatase